MRRNVEIRTCDRCGKEVTLDRSKDDFSEIIKGWGEGALVGIDFCPEYCKLYSETMTKFWRAENNG